MLGMFVSIYLPHLFPYSALEQALLYPHAVNWYTWVTHLGKYKLSTEDWANIKMVALWLKMLSTATTLMLLLKETTISWSFLPVCKTISGLISLDFLLILQPISSRDSYRHITSLQSISSSWTSCHFTCLLPVSVFSYACLLSMLTTMLAGLQHQLKDDPHMLHNIMWHKALFEEYFGNNYAASRPSKTSEPVRQSKTLDFIGSFGNVQTSVLSTQDELEQYLALLPVPFASCTLLQWWAAWNSEFPNLARFARDIFSIPGMCLEST
jgi:hypothetical protein